MNHLSRTLIISSLLITGFTACKKDQDPVFNIQLSTGTEKVTFNGLIGSEAGSAAGNSVYLDFSTNKTTEVSRSGWDLGFDNGADFRVILNNFSSAGVKVLSKNDLAAVDASDTVGLTLAVSQLDPQPKDLKYFDDIKGDITKTAIPAISATDASNPVIILNRGDGGGLPPRPWIKLRVLRNNAGYTLQYAGIKDKTFKIINIPKDADFQFRFVSLDNGIVNAAPEKAQWDLVWSYSVFEADFGDGIVPYNFSDLIAINHLAGVEVAKKIYSDAATADAAYEAFNKDSVSKTQLVNNRWEIGNSWRATQPATGARQDRFYVIKDAAGNYYKLKCISMGVGNDGGTRGKPEFKYTLIKD
ncbi:MAG: HmuY family protein [Ginsengibacter sp.]